MPRLIPLSIIALFALAGCNPAHVQPNAFVWNGTVPAGGWVHLRNLNGRISVASSSSGSVEISATKRWSSGSGEVHFVQHATDDGVIICTMYRAGAESSCTPKDYTPGSPKRNLRAFGIGGGSAEVSYVVRVPAGVKVDVSTVNGPIGVADVTSDVTAETVNGSVQVATRNGAVNATSVNGSITVAIDSLTTPGDLDLSTTNGSVTAQLPAALNADLDMETTTGKINTDFDLPITGVRPRKHLSVTLGTGGRKLRLNTTNGSVTLRKGA